MHASGLRLPHLMAAVVGTLVITGALASPAAANRPYHRVIASIDGLGAITSTFECQPSGELERCVQNAINMGHTRVHTRGEQPERSESVCLSVLAMWLLEGELVAAREEGGCAATDGQMEVDATNLTYATLASTAVPVELFYCNAMPGWESLCEGAPEARTVSVSAELAGTGELDSYRDHWRGELPWTPDCTELDVTSGQSRTGEGTVTVDGSPVEVGPFVTTLYEGKFFFHVFCRR